LRAKNNLTKFTRALYVILGGNMNTLKDKTKADRKLGKQIRDARANAENVLAPESRESDAVSFREQTIRMLRAEGCDEQWIKEYLEDHNM
jgi:hypothetical protein